MSKSDAEPAGPLGRLWRRPAARKGVIVAALLVAWELATRWAASPLLFPTAASVLQAFGRSIANGEVPGYAVQSLKVLLLRHGHRRRAGARPRHRRRDDASRRRRARDPHRDVQSAPRHRADAAGAPVVRPRREVGDLRRRPLRALAHGAQYLYGVRRRAADPAPRRAELRPHGLAAGARGSSCPRHSRISSRASRSAGPSRGGPSSRPRWCSAWRAARAGSAGSSTRTASR